jgi:hypothetical protein
MDRLLGRAPIEKTDAVVPNYMNNPMAVPRDPGFDYINLGDRMSKSWVAQEVLRALIQTFMKASWQIEPRFEKRCPKCGEESMDPKARKCPVCGSDKMEKPDREQRMKLIRFLETPNSQRRSFRDILYAILYNDLVYDVWYLAIENSSISMDGEEMLAPKEMRVLDSRYIRPVVDVYQKFHDVNYFCPACWDYRDQNETYEKPGPCPHCGYEMKPTAYMQIVNNVIVARWYKEQIITGSTHAFAPGIFGEPRGKSLWNILLIMENMDEWFLDTFNEGRLDKLVNFPNFDQGKLTDLMRKIQADQAKLQTYDNRTGSYRTKKSLRTMFVSSVDPITVHNVGINPHDIELMQYYAMCINAFCGVYGVQSIYISNLEKGRSGTTPAMQIEVENATIEEMQEEKEISFNTQFLPALGITDWIIKFPPPEKKDKKRDADTAYVVAQTAQLLQSSGFDVWYDEFNELQHEAKPSKDPMMLNAPKDKGKGAETLSEATGQYIKPTSTERAPHGTRPETQQDEERDKK